MSVMYQYCSDRVKSDIEKSINALDNMIFNSSVNDFALCCIKISDDISYARRVYLITSKIEQTFQMQIDCIKHKKQESELIRERIPFDKWKGEIEQKKINRSWSSLTVEMCDKTL